MPTSIESRCQVSIPFGATGEDSELCGAHASKVCENCQVICDSCAESFPCPLVSDGKHVFVTPETIPNPTTNPHPLFHVGQMVDATSFTDCFGKLIPAKTGLLVSDVRLISGQSVPDYYRVKADENGGLGYVEGAERFFVPGGAQ